MSITLNKDSWKVKDPVTGDYRSAAILTTGLPSEIDDAVANARNTLNTTIAEADALLNQTISQADVVLDNTISQAQSSINTLVARKDEIGAAINAMIDDETYRADPTLSTSGMPADSKATGNLITSIITHAKAYEDTCKSLLVRGDFRINIYNPVDGTDSALSNYNCRISSRKVMSFPYPVTLNIASGFRIMPYTIVNGAWKQRSWTQETYSLEAGKEFYCQIARVTENTSEVADVDEFLSAVTFVAPRVSFPIYIIGDSTTDDGAVISSQIADGISKGYKVFEFMGNKSIAYIKTPIQLSSGIAVYGNGITLQSYNKALTGISPTRIISATSLSDVLLDGFIFQGSYSSSIDTSARGNPDNLIYLKTCTDFIFRNCKITKYDTNIDSTATDTQNQYDEYGRSEFWCALIALSCTRLTLENLERTECMREGIILSKCNGFEISGFKSYDNDYATSYTPLSLFNCDNGKITKAYIVHTSATSIINFFTSNSVLSDSHLISTNSDTTGLDVGNEIGYTNGFKNNVIENNVIKTRITPQMKEGTTVGQTNLRITGNHIDVSDLNNYAIGMPYGDVVISDNTIIAKPARYCMHVANSPGTKVIKNNTCYGRNLFNLNPRADEVTTIISDGNSVSGNLIDINNLSNINDATRIKIKSSNDTCNGKLIGFGEVTETAGSADAINIEVKGGSSGLTSQIKSSITFSIDGHKYDGETAFIQADASTTIDLQNCEVPSCTGLLVSDNVTVDGKIFYCRIYDYATLGAGAVDLTAKLYNTRLKDNKSDLYSLGCYETASGDVVTVHDGADDVPIKSLKVALEPKQDLHGYDNPWPGGGTGVDLIPTGTDTSKGYVAQSYLKNDGTVESISGIAVSEYFAVKPSTVYRLIKTGEQSMVSASVCFYDSNKAYITGSGEKYNNRADFTKTSPATAAFARVSLPKSSGESTTLTFWENSNICPISGWTGCNVTRTGKNLFGIDTLYAENTLYSADGMPNANHNYNTYRVKAIANQPVTLVGVPVDTNFIYRVLLFNSNMGFAESLAYRIEGPVGVIKSTTVTPSNDGWLVICARKNMTGGQIELGSTATTYEPYQGTIIPISWQSSAGTVYGGTLDVTTGELVVDRAMVDLGTLAWSYRTSGSSVTPYFFTDISAWGVKYEGNFQSIAYSLLCSMYKVVARENLVDETICVDGATGTSQVTQIQIKDLNYTDAYTFKTAMSGVQLVYELETPITYHLTPHQITTLLGTNNVWSDAGNVTVTYPADTKMYVDNKIAAAVAAALNV